MPSTLSTGSTLKKVIGNSELPEATGARPRFDREAIDARADWSVLALFRFSAAGLFKLLLVVSVLVAIGAELRQASSADAVPDGRGERSSIQATVELDLSFRIETFAGHREGHRVRLAELLVSPSQGI